MTVSARAEPDHSRPLGHARLVLTGVSAAAAAGGFRIHREGYQTSNLGLRGWQVSEEVLRPIDIRQEGSETVLILGPRMTRNMEPGPVHLILPGLGEVPLFWPDDIEVFDGELPPDPIMPVEPAEPLVAARPPEPEPDPGETIRVRMDPPPVPEPTVRTPPPAPPPPRQPVALYLGGGVALLVLLAGLAWWWLEGRSREEPAPPPPPVELTPAPTPTPTPTPEPPPAPVPDAGVSGPPPSAPAPALVWPDGTDGLSLREVVGRASDAAAIFAVAQRRQAAGRHDDALVLFEEAAERGHAPAMTALGRLYDPNGFVPGRPFRSPDARAAARQYALAERAGDPAAAPLRAALRNWLQQQADGGNAAAATTLREFW